MHHIQFCTRDVDRRFCGGGACISRSDLLPKTGKKDIPPWRPSFSSFSGSEALWCIPFFPDLWCIPFSLFSQENGIHHSTFCSVTLFVVGRQTEKRGVPWWWCILFFFPVKARALEGHFLERKRFRNASLWDAQVQRHHTMRPCVSKQCPADGVWRIGRGGSPDRVLKTRLTPSESWAGQKNFTPSEST